MNYPAMAQDLDTLDAQQIDKATFIGHSMGGKAVMALTAVAPDRIDKTGGDRYRTGRLSRTPS